MWQQQNPKGGSIQPCLGRDGLFREDNSFQAKIFAVCWPMRASVSAPTLHAHTSLNSIPSHHPHTPISTIDADTHTHTHLEPTCLQELPDPACPCDCFEVVVFGRWQDNRGRLADAFFGAIQNLHSAGQGCCARLAGLDTTTALLQGVRCGAVNKWGKSYAGQVSNPWAAQDDVRAWVGGIPICNTALSCGVQCHM